MKIEFRLALVSTCAAVLCVGRAALAQTMERASVSSLGVEGNSVSQIPAISGDGRFVAFESSATNLVPGDTNGMLDIFVRDRQNGTTERASVSTGGIQASSNCSRASISGDGRFVAFESFASNLAVGDTNASVDIFVRDRQLGACERVSVSAAGAQGNADSITPSISADGRTVAFESNASNLVAGDANGTYDIFVRDRQSGTTELISVDSSGAQGNGISYSPVISADGRFVAFVSVATNLVAADTNAAGDIFVRDRLAGTTERVSISNAGAQANAASHSASISADGRCVAFASSAWNLVPNTGGGVFVRDRQLARTECASVDSSGAWGGGDQFNSISADGRFVAFWSSVSNIVAGDTNGMLDVFVRDRGTATTERISVDAFGVEGNGHSYGGEISADGRFVAFESQATNLVAGDTNSNRDIFVHERGPDLPLVYCTAGTTGLGACSASILASAHPSVSFANACNIVVSHVEGGRVGILFYGFTRTFQPWCAQVGGASYLCVSAPTMRTGVQHSGGTFGACNGSFALDWNAFQLTHPAALGAPWSAGSIADVQAWFRDPISCKGSNFSNAVELIYTP